MQLMISLCDGAVTRSVTTFSQLTDTANFTQPNVLIAALKHAYSAIKSGTILARVTLQKNGVKTGVATMIRAKNGLNFSQSLALSAKLPLRRTVGVCT